jgi:periplasmic protein TonB
MKSLLLFSFSICFLHSFAQDKNSFYALDANMNQTVLDSSKYILWIHEKEDSNWQWDYYKTWGPLVKSTSYADHDGTILNGRFCIYNSLGNLDSTGLYNHGKKNGSFYKLRSFTKDSIVMIWQYDFTQDSLVKTVDLLSEHRKNKDADTANGTESAYPGGISKWSAFLLHHLGYPQRAYTKEIQGQVQIVFIVDTEGFVIEPYIIKSVEYSLDQESIRVIRKSGNWIPAVQDGIRKKSYKMMPINFKLESQ